MKLWERIIENGNGEETTIGEEQFRFMSGTNTTDVVFALRQLLEKYREKNRSAYDFYRPRK